MLHLLVLSRLISLSSPLILPNLASISANLEPISRRSPAEAASWRTCCFMFDGTLDALDVCWLPFDGSLGAPYTRLTPPLTLWLNFGSVVADAPSPLSTPRSAAGQAPLRLGKPLRKKCRASPVLLFKRAGRVVAGSVGIVRATVPFHGEHDAQEPTKEG